MKLTRRNFIGTSAFAGSFFIGGCAASKSARGGRRPAPSERVTLGVIGCGGMGRANMDALLQDPRVQVVKYRWQFDNSKSGFSTIHCCMYGVRKIKCFPVLSTDSYKQIIS